MSIQFTVSTELLESLMKFPPTAHIVNVVAYDDERKTFDLIVDESTLPTTSVPVRVVPYCTKQEVTWDWRYPGATT